MSEQEPDGPYVYQPYGSVSDPERAKAKRLWGVGGVGSVHTSTTIKGLTKQEAEIVCMVLTECQGKPA